MALHFPLQVNGKHIGYFTAVRIEGDDQPDTVNTYEVHDWVCGCGHVIQQTFSYIHFLEMIAIHRGECGDP